MVATAELLTEEQVLRKHENDIRNVACAQLAGSSLKLYVELDDLMQEGRFALVEKWRKFDPSRGAELWTFAAFRVRGAMVDYLRKCGLKSRQQFAENPSLPGSLNENKVAEQLSYSETPGESSLDSFLSLEILKAVPPSERRFLAKHFVEGEPIYRIGARSGMSQSSASQFMSRIIRRLRESHAKREAADAAV